MMCQRMLFALYYPVADLFLISSHFPKSMFWAKDTDLRYDKNRT